MAPTREARMAKREPVNALPQQWPGHCFSRAEVNDVLAKLREHQDPKGAPYVGERLALTMLDMTPAELKEALHKLDNEAGNELTGWLFAAHESLEMRMRLVKAAIARVAIASGAAPWVDPEKD